MSPCARIYKKCALLPSNIFLTFFNMAYSFFCVVKLKINLYWLRKKTNSFTCLSPEVHNINFSLSIQYQLFFFPSYQYQFQYQLIQRGLININILSIIQKFPYQFQYQYQLIDSFINININISSHLKPFKISACLKYSYCRSTANFKVK